MESPFKKVIPIKFNLIKNLRPHEIFLFISMCTIENQETAIDPYTQEKFQIKFTNAPQGILLKVYCFPENQIIHIIKWALMSPHESNALHLEIYKNEIGNQKEGEEDFDKFFNEAYQELQDDMDCSMALQVNYN